MIRAAGILFATSDGKVLLMHRVAKAEQDGDVSGVWAFPGGGIEDEETAEQAARREIEEETGLTYDGPLKLWTRRMRDEVDFTTFVAKIDEFVPTMNDEHDSYSWVDRRLALSSSNLHPGVYVALHRFDMNELGVAEAIRDGELTSPQRYGNDLLLVALRITGTGGSYRPAKDEYVWRDPSIYMNDAFLRRCNGLSVIFKHPKKTLLNTQEYRDRSVGAIFVPYLKPEAQEVWGIAKIQDMDAAQVLETQEMSTSPAVLCLGDKVVAEDGRKLLIEDPPYLLDHLAILLGPGVWDKGGPLAGVESIDAASESESPLDVILRKLTVDQIESRIS